MHCNDDLSFLHNAVLTTISIDWELGNIVLYLKYFEEKSIYSKLNLILFKEVNVTRSLEWGMNDQINNIDLVFEKDIKNCFTIIIQLQSGDIIRSVFQNVFFEKLSDS